MIDLGASTLKHPQNCAYCDTAMPAGSVWYRSSYGLGIFCDPLCGMAAEAKRSSTPQHPIATTKATRSSSPTPTAASKKCSAGCGSACPKCKLGFWVEVTALYNFPCNLCGKCIKKGDRYKINNTKQTAKCMGCSGSPIGLGKTMSTGVKKRFEITNSGNSIDLPCHHCGANIKANQSYWYDTQLISINMYCTEACAMAENGVLINEVQRAVNVSVTMNANGTCIKCLGAIMRGQIAWVDKRGEAICGPCERSGKTSQLSTKKGWRHCVATIAGMPCPRCGTNSQVGDIYYSNPDLKAKPHWLCDGCYNGGAASQPAQTMGQQVMGWKTYTVTKGATCGDCGSRIGRGQSSYRKKSSGGTQFRCLNCKPAILGAPNALYDGVIGTSQTVLQPTIKSIDLGTAPSKEQVACFGGRHYDERVERELDIWEPYLIGKFGTPPRGAAFARKVKQHAAGREITLWLDYDENVEAARKYANDLITNLPEYYAAQKQPVTADGKTQQQAQAAAPAGIMVDSNGKQWQALTKNSDLKARPCASCGHRPLKGENYFDGGKGKGNLRCGNCPPN